MTGPSQQTVEQTKQAVDGAIGVGAILSPVWVYYVETGLTVFMLAGGALLLGLRIYLTIREIRSKKED